MNAPDEPQVLEFEGFVLDARQRRLVGPDGIPVAIASRAFDLLLYLAQHPGELLDKQRLMKAVWPNTIVEDNNLSQHISALRKLLGEAPGQHRFIITVPGRGLRFVPVVQRREGAPDTGASGMAGRHQPPAEPARPPQATLASAAERLPDNPLSGATADSAVQRAAAVAEPPRSQTRIRRTLPAAAIWGAALVLLLAGVAAFLLLRPGTSEQRPAQVEQPSVAVLPFADVSPNKDEANFTDGLSEEIMNALGRLQGLRVLGRTSSFAFKGHNEDVRKIAHTLGVSHVLEGSVRRDGDKLRITAQLVDASTGSQKWAETFDGTLSDVFAVQEQIATSVASALQLRLIDAQRGAIPGGTTNLAAYEAYLSARAIINNLGITDARKAIDDLERAVTIDPQFALAWATLAEAYTFAVDFPADSALPLTPVELQQRISTAALRAFELAPNAPQTLRSAGSISMQNRDWIEAGRRFQKAAELAPPFDFDANLFQAWFFLNIGRPRDAIPYLERAIRAEPLLLRPVAVLASAYDMVGETDKALTLVESAGALKGEPSMGTNAHLSILLGRRDAREIREFLQRNPSPFTDNLLGKLDNPEAARAELRRVYANRPSADAAGGLYGVAAWAPYFGDAKLALDAIRAIGPTQNVFIIWQSSRKSLRRLPEFKQLVREFGLVDYWRTSGNWTQFCRPLGADDFECQ
jgi:TolB-like protein/DNA-binding winged helix-turn-helix (wHTH) protein